MNFMKKKVQGSTTSRWFSLMEMYKMAEGGHTSFLKVKTHYIVFLQIQSLFCLKFFYLSTFNKIEIFPRVIPVNKSILLLYKSHVIKHTRFRGLLTLTLFNVRIS